MGAARPREFGDAAGGPVDHPSMLGMVEPLVWRVASPQGSGPWIVSNAYRRHGMSLLDAYLSRKEEVAGWFVDGAAVLFVALDAAQRGADVSGHVLEIGVHHGKSAGLLGALLGLGEVLTVCDVFEDQVANPTGSGAGDRQVFDEWMARWVPDRSRLRVVSKRSEELVSDDVVTPLRIAHVDGGHSAQETRNDLQFASDHLADDGVVILDDVFNARWPGVIEGLFEFLRMEPHALEPVAIGFNKVVLVRPSQRRSYVARLRDEVEVAATAPQQLLEVDWLGGPCLLARPTRHSCVPLERARHEREQLSEQLDATSRVVDEVRGRADALEHQLDVRTRELAAVRDELDACRAHVRAAREAADERAEERDRLTNRLEAVHASTSWRVGRFITRVPGRVKRWRRRS